MTREHFLKLAAEYELGHVANQLLSTAIPAARVLKEGLRPGRRSDMTFLGGMPCPMPREWPHCEEVLLTFVGQVDTSSLPAGVCPVPLPVGILQFFVPPTGKSHGYEPSLDLGRVIFVKSGPTEQQDSDPVPKTKRTKPARSPSVFSPVLRFFRSCADVPTGASNLPHKPFPMLGFDWEVFPSLYASAPDRDALWLPETAQPFDFNFGADEDNYFELRQAVLARHQSSLRAQMFGFPYALQEDMEALVDAASGNRSVNEFREWILLFALDSSCGGLAPEAACYYYWVHRDDLAEGSFEEVWLCIQQD